MTDRQTALARYTTMCTLLVGLSLFPGPLPSQEAAFDRLWRHDTGG